jgi:hypothetical protein
METDMTTNTTDEAAFIPCLNFCMTDQETGYCLTCGRPPIPVAPSSTFGPTFSPEFGANLMAKITLQETTVGDSVPAVAEKSETSGG